MIKLTDILLELKSVNGLDKVDTSKQYQVLWSEGTITVIDPQGENRPPMTLAKIVQMTIDPKQQLVKIHDYDDWSSFKNILSAQQAVKDLIRANLIDASWDIDITMVDLKKIIGSVKVKDFLEYDASFTKTIPVAFHGTTTRELKSIMKLGVVPPSATDRETLKWNNFYQEDSGDKTYWTIDYGRAKYYAEHAVQMYNAQGIMSVKPIVIEIHNWPIANVTADDDFKSNMSMVQLMIALRKKGKGKPIDVNSPIHSIRSTAQFAIKGRVPANKIVKIHKI